MSKPIPADIAQAALEHWRFELPDTGCLISASPWNEGNGYHFFQGHLHHRAAHTAVHGPIPDGMVVDHMCFNRSCMNPDHLRLLTLDENTRRRNGATFPLGQCRWGHPLSDQREMNRLGRIQRTCGTCMDERNRRVSQITAALYSLELAYGLGGHESKSNYRFKMRVRAARVAAVSEEAAA